MVDAVRPSLDHLRTFVAVAEEGSFNRAAKRLGRAISVVSYAIANLEAQLDVSLFAREGSRRPVLTASGRALLAEARSVLDEVDALMAKVRSLHQGLEAQLGVVIDVMMPGSVIAPVLREFQRMFPTVALNLQVEALGAVGALLLEGRAHVGVGGPVIADQPELERQGIGSVRLVTVASPSHPLATGPVRPGEARKHFQLVLTDRSDLTRGREFSVISPRTWRLADLGAKHALLRAGIGWGNMPYELVREDLAGRTLVELDLPERPGVDYPLSAMWRRDDPPGPAGCWLIDALGSHLAEIGQDRA